MADPKITLSMRGGGTEGSTGVEAKAGGEVKVQYDPAKVQASIDFTRPDKLVFTFQGDLSLQAIGIPAVTIGGGVKIDDKGASYSGTVEWAIDASVATKVEMQHTPAGTSGMMTLSFKF